MPSSVPAWRFLAEALFWFALAVPLYWWGGGLYAALIETVSNGIAALGCPRLAMDVNPQGPWLVNVHECSPPRDRAFSVGKDLFTVLAFLNLPVVTALLAATPLPPAARARLLLKGWAACVAMNSLSVVACMYALAVFCTDTVAGRGCRNLAGLLGPWTYVIAITVWAGLAGRHWFTSRPLPADNTPHPRPRGGSKQDRRGVSARPR